MLEFEKAHTRTPTKVLPEPAQLYMRGPRDGFEMGRIIAGRLLAEKQEREAKGLAKAKKPRR